MQKVRDYSKYRLKNGELCRCGKPAKRHLFLNKDVGWADACLDCNPYPVYPKKAPLIKTEGS